MAKKMATIRMRTKYVILCEDNLTPSQAKDMQERLERFLASEAPVGLLTGTGITNIIKLEVDEDFTGESPE